MLLPHGFVTTLTNYILQSCVVCTCTTNLNISGSLYNLLIVQTWSLICWLLTPACDLWAPDYKGY